VFIREAEVTAALHTVSLIGQPDELAFAAHPLDVERVGGSKRSLVRTTQCFARCIKTSAPGWWPGKRAPRLKAGQGIVFKYGRRKSILFNNNTEQIKCYCTPNHT
jgi:hypothetical protein